MHKPKFKPGDKVVVSNPTFSFKHHLKDRTFTIRDIDPSGADFYKAFTEYRNKPMHYYTVVETACCYILFEDEIKGVNEEMFTKKDLKNGDVILYKDGSTAIAIPDANVIISKNGYNNLDNCRDDLTNEGFAGISLDIMAVRRPRKPEECYFSAFTRKCGELVYERKEYEEMTVADIEKALGKKIKIVKEK